MTSENWLRLLGAYTEAWEARPVPEDESTAILRGTLVRHGLTEWEDPTSPPGEVLLTAWRTGVPPAGLRRYLGRAMFGFAGKWAGNYLGALRMLAREFRRDRGPVSCSR